VGALSKRKYLRRKLLGADTRETEKRRAARHRPHVSYHERMRVWRGHRMKTRQDRDEKMISRMCGAPLTRR
ncbi:hypothetical protein KI387_029745, partial [Taxus chinensis]